MGARSIRRSVKPTLLPAGNGEAPMQMPAHTAIILVPFLMQRDKDLWGPDAMAFRPERWLDIGNKEREGFMPWNAGPRMVCSGLADSVPQGCQLTRTVPRTAAGIDGRAHLLDDVLPAFAPNRPVRSSGTASRAGRTASDNANASSLGLPRCSERRRTSQRRQRQSLVRGRCGSDYQGV